MLKLFFLVLFLYKFLTAKKYFGLFLVCQVILASYYYFTVFGSISRPEKLGILFRKLIPIRKKGTKRGYIRDLPRQCVELEQSSLKSPTLFYPEYEICSIVLDEIQSGRFLHVKIYPYNLFEAEPILGWYKKFIFEFQNELKRADNLMPSLFYEEEHDQDRTLVFKTKELRKKEGYHDKESFNYRFFLKKKNEFITLLGLKKKKAIKVKEIQVFSRSRRNLWYKLIPSILGIMELRNQFDFFFIIGGSSRLI